MTLIRRWDMREKHAHKGPVPGGVFFAHRDFNDLASYWGREVSFADLPYLLRTGRVWIQDVERPDLHPWREIRNLKEVPTFRRVDASTADSVAIEALPFLPEFYFVPKNWRGARFLRRSALRTKEFGENY